ncbi:MAG: hypothetical protein N4A35_14220 [Flavobacteriales bacterium]|jgi:hypothetical protein|nr:hypothetical protein [Flavobacteriales bacterium]
MNKINKSIIIACTAFFSLIGYGQKLNNSPYTRYGLGELSEPTTATYFGMSGANVALAEFNHLNIANPASYSSLIKYKPIFDVGIFGKVQNLKTTNDNSTQSNFALRNFSLGMPIGSKTGVAFGLMPYSTVGYDINSYTLNEGDSVRYNYEGNGGINKVFVGVGRTLINKGDSLKLSIGANASYLFGTIDHSRSVIFDNTTFYNSRINDFKTINGVNLDFGLQYSQQINKGLTLAFGIDYTMNNQLNVSKDYYAYNYKYSTFSVIETEKDTVDFQENITGKINLPTGIKVGIAATFNQKLTTSLQYEQSNWNDYSELYDGIENTPSELNNSSKLSLGVAYTPTLMKDWNSKSRSIFQKSTYRLGLKTVNTNIAINSTVIKDYGISFGISTPLLSSRSFSSVDLGIDLGKLGTTDNNLIEDNYFRFYLGFSLAPSNYDRWFRKRKYD